MSRVLLFKYNIDYQQKYREFFIYKLKIFFEVLKMHDSITINFDNKHEKFR